MQSRLLLISLLSFIFISTIVFYVTELYKKSSIEEYKIKYYKNISSALTNEVSTLIKEKENTTLSIALLIAKDNKLLNILENNSDTKEYLKNISLQLRNETDFKNVWFQLINAKGVSVARSWSQRSQDNIAIIRDDVKNMLNKPRIISSISIGNFDLSFKAMVPLYSDNGDFRGFIEVITHFNSIAVKIKDENFEPVIVVDKKYTKQLTHPFTKLFVNDNYIANFNASESIREYISKAGIENLVSPNSNYIVKDGYLIVNYTIFDVNNNIIANFLMFKRLSFHNDESINDIIFTANVFLVITILIIAVAFYILYVKYSKRVKVSQSRLVILFSALFLISYLTYLGLIYFYYQSQIENYIRTDNLNVAREYKIINSKYSDIAKTIFKNIINKSKIQNILLEAQEPSKRLKAREELFNVLKKDYEVFKDVGVKQLHFHLKDNRSFLRFHRPSKYDDDLSDVRSTVTWVNSNLKYIEGFEEGRIYNGFRYIYPIYFIDKGSNKHHLGSVEISFDAYSFLHDFSLLDDVKSEFMIKKKIVAQKVFLDEQSNYTQSPIKEFLFETAITQRLKNASLDLDISLIDPAQYNQIIKKIDEGHIFSVLSKNSSSTFTFIPLINPVTNRVVATFVLQTQNNSFVNLNNLFYILSLGGFVLILFIYLYIYKEIISKQELKQLSHKTQKILDTQNSIIIVTDGTNLIDVNKRFLEFFDFKDLHSFTAEHSCVCDLFIKDDRFFSMDKVQDNENWVDTLSQLESKERVVLMLDKKSKHHSFMITLNYFDHNYILVFSDISDTIKEKFILEEKVSKDKLTQTYNREFFDTSIEFIIENIEPNKHLGIVFFDIDFFKKVNDTYGHDVGDKVLIECVHVVKNNIRNKDILIRWGGEEFIILINVESLEKLYEITQHVRTSIANRQFKRIGHLTCSFGVTLHRTNEDILTSIKRADEALYEAKQNGRNQVIKKP